MEGGGRTMREEGGIVDECQKCHVDGWYVHTVLCIGNVTGLQTRDGSWVRVMQVRVRVGRSQPWKNPHSWHGFTNPWQVAGTGKIIIIIIIISESISDFFNHFYLFFFSSQCHM